MQMPMAFDALIESLLNSHLKNNSDSAADVKALSGRVVAIHGEGLDVTRYLQFCDDGVLVLSQYDADPDCTVSATPAGFAARLLRDDASAVSIRGNSDVAQAFDRLIREAGVEWEELASRLMGDVGAHQLFRVLHTFRRWATQAQTSLQSNVGEYLTEEIRLVPGALEIADYLDDVDQLRDQIARLEARLTHLEQSETV